MPGESKHVGTQLQTSMHHRRLDGKSQEYVKIA